MLRVCTVTRSDDLRRLVAEINGAEWDEDNEIHRHDAEALAAYLERRGTIFLTCHDVSVEPPALLGMASAAVQVKPYGGQRWLYVDEVDVCADRRRRGAGTAMMNRLLEIARGRGCREVWLATEDDNAPARALYRSLEPDDELAVTGYTYTVEPRGDAGSNGRGA